MVNRVMLLGRLVRDPVLAYTPGKAVALTKFTLALPRRRVKGGRQADDVDYVDIEVWRESAEACAQFLKKGSQVHVEGRLTQNRWEDRKTGEKRSKLLVTADFVTFVDARKDNAAADENASDGGEPQSSEPDMEAA